MIPICFMGIDPGRYGHGVVAMASDGQLLSREKVDNSEEAISELIAGVVDLAGGRGRALWIIEANAGDGAVLIGELLARGEAVTTLTPNEVAARRKARRQAHKTDLIDAEICAEIGRESHAGLRRLAAVPEVVAELRVLSR
jgi:transposase